jgi:hypothetical protein
VSARRPPRTSERASATGSAETTASTRDSGSARGSSDRCSAGRDTRPPLRTRLDRLTPSRHYRGRGSWRRTPIEHGRAIRASCSSTGHCRITRRASQRVQPYEVHDGQRTDPMCRRLAARTRGAHGPAALASRRDDHAHDALAHGIHGVTGGRAAHALATAPDVGSPQSHRALALQTDTVTCRRWRYRSSTSTFAGRRPRDSGVVAVIGTRASANSAGPS